MDPLVVDVFTDPGCPFAFSAEPALAALRWRFGDQIALRSRMIVLSNAPEDYDRKGLTPEIAARGAARLAASHGMPLRDEPPERMVATRPACRAVVAARTHVGRQAADRLLRALRVRHFAGELMDTDPVLDAAATDAGLDPAALRAWTGDDAVHRELEVDVADARSPLPAAAGPLDRKLAAVEGGGRRYTAPSLVAEGLVAPGFQPLEVYEVVLANARPSLEPRDAPDDPLEVLRWADWPLATAEVAAVMGTSIDAARQALEATDATFTPAAADGYWKI